MFFEASSDKNHSSSALEESIREFIQDQRFPCVGAKSAVQKGLHGPAPVGQRRHAQGEDETAMLVIGLTHGVRIPRGEAS